MVDTDSVPVNGDGTYATSGGVAGVNLGQNGGFETGDFTGWTVTPAAGRQPF